ncbi:MAG: polyprenyl synthetase family protein [Clostridia bacterium]|nr:polyprenyl synthetase family protein [Clostridia bacterium]
MKTMDEYRACAEDALQKLFLDRLSLPQGRIYEAARYSLLLGGKRIRPVLTLAAADFASGEYSEALGAACAMEMVHTYSLIHDDLPAMDDDELRRGKPSSHVVYGEALAILAGDGLLTDAFTVLATYAAKYPDHAQRHLEAVRILSSYAGMDGMVGGQVADVETENADSVDPDLVRFIETHKTSALLTAAILIGLEIGGADAHTKACFRRYGEHLGIAFQIADDLLDLHATPEELGKSVGKDLNQNKATYPAVFGEEQAEQALLSETALACEAIRDLPGDTRFFTDLAQQLAVRKK